jgi:hypothetical protein
MAKEIEPQELPRSENKHELMINYFWLCVLSNVSGNWVQTSMNELFATIRGSMNSNMLHAPS